MPKRGKKLQEATHKGSGKKKSKKGPKKASDHVPDYASDDDRLYGNYEEPDPESREYIFDDIDEFHANREKILLDTGYKAQQEVEESEEEEVLALDSEESDDEEIRNLKAQLRRVKQIQRSEAVGSDLDDASEDDEEEGLPDSKAWGSRRNRYYGDDDIDLQELEDDEAEAVMEEKEALRLQRQMAEQLEEEDFGLDRFKPPKKVEECEEKEEKIVTDLSRMSKNEKLKLLRKEAPELFPLIEEFKEKMTEAQERLCPLKEWIEKNQLTGKAVDYIHTKLRLNLSYCTNVVFYLMMKAKQAPVHNHPVIKRLLQYKNIMKQLEPLDKQMKGEMDEIVEKLKQGEDVDFNKAPKKTFVRRKKVDSKSSKQKRPLSDLVSESEGSESDDMYEDLTPAKQKKLSGEKRYETKDEKAALEYYEMMKAGRPAESDLDEEEEDSAGGGDGEENEELDEEGKRAISYQIEKNKGLTAHKKKELRNPRVKHRMKYRKAKIRRKGQVREPRTEMQRYGGEISGIRMGVKRGVKLK